jgi:hypothetical protein
VWPPNLDAIEPNERVVVQARNAPASTSVMICVFRPIVITRIGAT